LHEYPMKISGVKILGSVLGAVEEVEKVETEGWNEEEFKEAMFATDPQTNECDKCNEEGENLGDENNEKQQTGKDKKGKAKLCLEEERAKAIMPDVGVDDIDNKFAGNLMPEAGPILLGALIGIYYTAMLGYELLWHKKPDFRELDFWDIIKKDIMKPICLLNSLTIGCQIFGFIKGRYILDGVKKQDGIILKIDFEKAEILIPLYMLSIFWAPKEDAMAGGKKDLENKEGLWQKIGTLISGKAFWKDNVIWLLDKKGFSCSSLDSLENKKRSLHLYIQSYQKNGYRLGLAIDFG
ncbi:hypothetical protein ACJX0J_036718, partial [Zea mays]